MAKHDVAMLSGNNIELGSNDIELGDDNMKFSGNNIDINDDNIDLHTKKSQNKALYNNIVVKSFTGLLVDFATNENASVIIRGVRNMTDFESEFQMSYLNSKLNNKIQTIFLASTENSAFISSSFVKAVAQLNGALATLTSDYVAKCLYNGYHGKK